MEVCPSQALSSTYFKFLYENLKERLQTPNENISHVVLPPYADHIKFCHADPYLVWYVIVNAHIPDHCIGSIYISKDNEIGIHIRKGQQGRGIGKDAVKEMLKMFPGLRPIKANINPNNERSIKFFRDLGFVPFTKLIDDKDEIIQITMIKTT